MITVTKPFLPPQKEYQEYIDGIWERNWLTNNGPLVNELELRLKSHLQLQHLLFVTNGTVALQIAIKALDIKGQVITTPFSYVATTSSVVWEGCEPVFVDIEEDTMNINPDLIESHITDRTSAILATHVYGNPCNVDKIEQIAKRRNLKVIYDGAHGFGVKYKDRSLFDYGDICTTSFHATKPFHTVEGGALITRDPKLLKKMAFMRNFGHDGPGRFSELGINGKNSEFHAAMGLVNLNYIDSINKKRKALYDHYQSRLANFKGRLPLVSEGVEYNYSYYPIVFENEEALLKCLQKLKDNNILTRRYFYPSLAELPYIDNSNTLTVTKSLSSRVLCLPLYYQLSQEEIDLITRLILRVQNY